jgi:SAM-dependent methyltransferase
MEPETGTRPETDRQFAGPVPLVYERLLVPMLFRSYARDLATRVHAQKRARLLELAAGTGVLTRELAERLPETTSIVATDLNPPMLAEASRNGTKREVRWQQADAMQLPFGDASFDLVVCQFGVMFFPDKAHAYAEVRRVLEPGGAFLFNTWTRIEANEFANVVQQVLIQLYPDNPPRFMARTPHGYFEPELIRSDLLRAGFTADAVITPLGTRCQGASARLVARAFCEGTPLRPELEARGPGELLRATDAAEAALVQRFGSGEIEGAISALVVEVSAPLAVS